MAGGFPRIDRLAGSFGRDKEPLLTETGFINKVSAGRRVPSAFAPIATA
jgi:hypothetical protein